MSAIERGFIMGAALATAVIDFGMLRLLDDPDMPAEQKVVYYTIAIVLNGAVFVLMATKVAKP